MTGMFTMWPAVFLSFALFLTLSKWVYYICLFLHSNKKATRSVNFDDNHLDLMNKRKFITICAAISIISVLIPTIVFNQKVCQNIT